MTSRKSIREQLGFMDLSPEEKASRGILGRLFGPCASIIDSTRNGRKYPEELWDIVFNKNEIVKELLDNGGIPMELDHPIDREETDSSKIAAMLPCAPKKDEDGHLICYIDLIDTPCGRIAYQLAKYGFKLGISSRGSGDLRTDGMGNEFVDPDTYDFTAFDLVLIPAVKDARMTMCEAADTKTIKLKAALTEDYNNATKEGKKIMKEALDGMNIKLDCFEESNEKDADELQLEALYEELEHMWDDEDAVVEEEVAVNGEEIKKMSMEYEIGNLVKDEIEAIDGYRTAAADASIAGMDDVAADLNDIKGEEEAHIGELVAVLKKVSPEAAENVKSGTEEVELEVVAPEEKIEEEEMSDDFELVDDEITLESAKNKSCGKKINESAEDEVVIESEEIEDEEEVEAEDEEESEEEVEEEEVVENESTIKDLIDYLKEFDKDAKIDFAPIEIEGKTYAIDAMNLTTDEEGKVVINLGYVPADEVEEDNIELVEPDEEIEAEENEAEIPEDGGVEQIEDDGMEDLELFDDEEKSDEDNVDSDVVESLKNALRDKQNVQRELNTLKQEKLVGDAENEKLKGQLESIKESFLRVSSAASKNIELKQENEQLKAQLKESQEKSESRSQKLTEGVEKSVTAIKSLKESLAKKDNELKDALKQLKDLNEQINLRAQQVKNYKAKMNEMLEHYVDSKASMLGVNVKEITNRLKEGFTLKDIDSVCDSLMSRKANVNSLPYGMSSRSQIKVNEGMERNNTIYSSPEYGYEIDDSLLELAGLK